MRYDDSYCIFLKKLIFHEYNGWASPTRYIHEAVELIWKQVQTKEEGIVLMLIYSGVRVGEMINLEKTKPFFIEWLNDGTNQTEYLLCNDKGKRLNYTTFRRKIYDPFVKGLDIDLTPHCTRYTTISMLAEKHVSQTAIKKIVGHKGAMDITERVYTHLNIQELIDALNLI